MDRPDYTPARLESWRYASAYPRIPYLETATTVDPDDILNTEIWLNNPYRQLEDVMWKAIQAEMEEKFRRFFGGIDMNKDIKLKDLRSGYVVELRNGTKWLVARAGNDFTRILVDNRGSWGYLDRSYNEDLTMKDSVEGVFGGVHTKDIVKVWGLVTTSREWGYAAGTATGYRPVLWERKEAKKLTVDQISELLGYPVEIVGENR